MNININECLRYLGYKEKDEETVNQINRCIEEIKEKSQPKFTYKILPIEVTETSVNIKDTKVSFKSKNLANLLSGCDKCVILAATMGVWADKMISYYQKTDMSYAVVFDATLSEATESICNMAEEQLKSEGYMLTPRFSPGYGDLSIMHQKDFLTLSDAYKTIGLTCTDSMLLTPTKSVTAIIGIKKC